jgi:GNAT superfamily N-acetyltransferase
MVCPGCICCGRSKSKDNRYQSLVYSLFHLKGTRLYLEDLIVTEEFRGKGVGKKLFDATVEEARQIGVSGMMWQVLDWNQPAIDFYKKYGTDIISEWLIVILTL